MNRSQTRDGGKAGLEIAEDVLGSRIGKRRPGSTTRLRGGAVDDEVGCSDCTVHIERGGWGGGSDADPIFHNQTRAREAHIDDRQRIIKSRGHVGRRALDRNRSGTEQLIESTDAVFDFR